MNVSFPPQKIDKEWLVSVTGSSDIYSVHIDPFKICSYKSNKEYTNKSLIEGTLVEKVLKTRRAELVEKPLHIFNQAVSRIVVIPITTDKNTILEITCFLDTNIRSLERITTYHSLYSLQVQNNHYRERIDKLYLNDKHLQGRDIFIASMSHELRTPLNGLHGYVQLLSNVIDKNNAKQKEYVININRCTSSLIEIINDILDYSKIVSGKAKVSMTSMRIQEVLEVVKSVISQKVREKEHTFLINIEKDFPEVIVSDKQKITQILINLLSNAVKFTPAKGNITLTIKIENDSNLGYLHCSVTDNGPGISDEKQRYLFQPFNRFDEKNEGCGLGLTISKKLVELLKGRITVDSEVGRGSTFSFIVRYQTQSDIETKIVNTNLDLTRGKHVLICTSDKMIRTQLTSLLLSWKCVCFPVSAEDEALSLSESSPFNIAFTDSEMLVSRLKESNSFLPIVAINQNLTRTERRILTPLNNLEIYEALTELLAKVSSKKYGSLKGCSHLRIGIAEDVEMSRNMLLEVLSSLKFTDVRVAEDGLQALEIAEKCDVLLLDLKMPQLDGYSVMKKIQEMRLKVIVVPLTASVSAEDQAKCTSYGCSYFLCKPLDINELRMVLTSIAKCKDR